MSERGSGNSFGSGVAGMVGVLVLMASSLFLFIALDDLRFGTQIATGIVYTGAVFVFVFLRTRFGSGFAVRSVAVRRCLPHLLRVHAFALILVVGLQSAALAHQHKLPHWWVQQDAKGRSNLELAMLIIFTVMGTVEIRHVRNLLWRNLDPQEN